MIKSRSLKNIIRYYRYRGRWHLGFLTHLDLELNTNCDHKCVFCWHGEGAAFRQGKMDMQQAERIMAQAQLAGILSVKFNLRGEPLINKDLVDAVEYAKRLNYVETIINTNGSHLIELWDKLRNCLDKMIVSIGSTDPMQYAKLHGISIDKYTRLHNGLAYCHKTGGSCKIVLNCHEGTGIKIDYKRLKRMYPRFKIRKRYLMNRRGEHLSNMANRKRKRVCPHLLRRLTVQADGTIYPCCISYDSPEDIRLGNNIMQAMKARMILMSRHIAGDLPETCKNCTSADIYK